MSESSSSRRITEPTLPLTGRRAVAWRRIALGAFGIWLATRAALFLFTYFTVILNGRGVVRQGGFVSTVQSLHSLLAAWSQWDTHWYILISRLGYFTHQATAFFPLYPTLVGAFSFLLGDGSGPVWPAADPTRFVVALAVSNLATLAGFIGLGLLAAHEESGATSWSAAIRVAVAYPLAFFLAAAYTEGLFFALAVFTLLLARRGRWRWAAATAFLAALTRPTGVILFLPLVWEYGRQHGWWSAASWTGGAWRQRLSPQAVAEALPPIAAVPLGVATYMAYLAWRFGQPLLFLQAQRAWSRRGWPLWRTGEAVVQRLIEAHPWSYWQALELLDAGLLAIFFVILVLAVRRLPFAFTLYMLGLFYVSVANPLTSAPDVLSSTGRFLTASIPIFLVLARWSRSRPWLDLLIVSGGFMIQASLLTFFFSGGWIG